MLLIFFKRFYTNPIYNFMISIRFFALFFLISNLILILYSQLGKQCICTHTMRFYLLRISPNPSKSIRNLIEPYNSFSISSENYIPNVSGGKSIPNIAPNLRPNLTKLYETDVTTLSVTTKPICTGFFKLSSQPII